MRTGAAGKVYKGQEMKGEADNEKTDEWRRDRRSCGAEESVR